MSLLAAYAPHALTCVSCGTACLLADVLTGTAWFQTPQKGSTMFDLSEPRDIDLASLTTPELSDWDDLTGINLDGFPDADDESSEVLVTSVPWLHSLLYSDYQDPADDDDRATMNIPAHVLDAISEGL